MPKLSVVVTVDSDIAYQSLNGQNLISAALIAANEFCLQTSLPNKLYVAASDIEKIRDRMYRRLLSTIDFELNQITQLRNRPVMKDPSVMVTTRHDEIKVLRDRSIRSFNSILEIEKKELKGVRDHLRSLSPQSTMDRGYSVVQLSDGSIVRDATKLKAGSVLRIRAAKGETSATVNEK